MIQTQNKSRIYFYSIKMLYLTAIMNLTPISTVAIEDKSSYNSSSDKFSIGVEAGPYLYREPRIMNQKGRWYGLDLSYSHIFENNFVIQPELRIIIGSSKYSSTISGYSDTKFFNGLHEIRLLGKKNLLLSDSIKISPFLGFGYRYKEDDSRGIITTTNNIGLKRESQYYYIPLGLDFEYINDNNWGVNFLAEYDIFLKGRQKTITPDKYNFIHDQKKGFGARGEILLTKEFERYKLSGGPFINYWNIKQSKFFTNYKLDKNHPLFITIEPKNHTQEWGIKVKFTF